MTRKEKEKLGDLVIEVVEHANVLHTPAADILVKRLSQADDTEILDILISHFHSIRIYELYRSFDHEASVRDIEKLLKIIHQGGR